jgi:hypothetical protein
MAIEMVDLSINSMAIFHSYVNVYQRVIPVVPHKAVAEVSKIGNL